MATKPLHLFTKTKAVVLIIWRTIHHWIIARSLGILIIFTLVTPRCYFVSYSSFVVYYYCYPKL